MEKFLLFCLFLNSSQKKCLNFRHFLSLCLLNVPGFLQHPVDVNPITAVGLAGNHMRDRADKFPILKNWRSAHSLNNAAGLVEQCGIGNLKADSFHGLTVLFAHLGNLDCVALWRRSLHDGLNFRRAHGNFFARSDRYALRGGRQCLDFAVQAIDRVFPDRTNRNQTLRLTDFLTGISGG